MANEMQVARYFVIYIVKRLGREDNFVVARNSLQRDSL
jgi:hypothetical protein